MSPTPELMKKECRLAAEPLGYAGYFTPCYVIDLGGLLDPEFGITGKQAKPPSIMQKAGAQATITVVSKFIRCPLEPLMSSGMRGVILDFDNTIISEDGDHLCSVIEAWVR